MPNSTAKTTPDFSGYATKYGIVCSDGRTILPDAFKHLDGCKVPLFYHHNTKDIESMVGHVILEHRDGVGVWVDGYINPKVKNGPQALALVEHGDIDCLSISANHLRQNGSCVVYGNIREVSLVPSGANPGAKIENSTYVEDGVTHINDEEADIFCGGALDPASLAHEDEPAAEPNPPPASGGCPVGPEGPQGPPSPPGEDVAIQHAENYDEVQKLFDNMSAQQRSVIFAMLASADQTGNVERQFNDLDDTQKQAFYAMMTAAMNHADDGGATVQGDTTVGEIWDTFTEKQQLAAAAILASLIEDEEGKNETEQADMDPLAETLEHADGETVGDVLDTLSDVQKFALSAIIASYIEAGSAEHSDDTPGATITNTEGELTTMQKNVFDNPQATSDNKKTLTHADMDEIITQARGDSPGNGFSLKKTFMSYIEGMEHADYGIDNIEVLFPDAQLVRNSPDTVTRDKGWVGPFLSGINKTPFARLRSTAADLTEYEARAKGYITAEQKKEEVFPAMKRETNPQTIYKKQKLDRDNIIDITSFDVVAWIKSEMRTMLDEELARAALIGDGRDPFDDDKIKEDCVRPVWTDDELYVKHITLPAGGDIQSVIDEIMFSSEYYHGSGTPYFYTNKKFMFQMLAARNAIGDRQYKNLEELKLGLMVRDVITVEVMNGAKRMNGDGDDVELLGILLNPADYTFGADKGGQVAFFEDFDIDFNQNKFLIETRVSGALTRPRSAVVIERLLA